MASEPSLRDPGAHMPQPVPYETSARRLNVYHIPTRSSVSGLMLFSPHYLLSFLSSVLTPSFLESPYKHFSFIKVPVRCQNIPALSLLSLTQPLNLVSLGYHLFDTSAFSLPWLPMLLLRNDRFLLSQWFFIKTQIQKIRLLSKYFKTVSSKKPRFSFALRFPARYSHHLWVMIWSWCLGVWLKNWIPQIHTQKSAIKYLMSKGKEKKISYKARRGHYQRTTWQTGDKDTIALLTCLLLAEW